MVNSEHYKCSPEDATGRMPVAFCYRGCRLLPMRVPLPVLIVKRLKGESFGPGLAAQAAQRSLYQKSERECLELLRKLSGEDFGEDMQAWSRWAKRLQREFDGE